MGEVKRSQEGCEFGSDILLESRIMVNNCCSLYVFDLEFK